jgi:hypothetical protein
MIEDNHYRYAKASTDKEPLSIDTDAPAIVSSSSLSTPPRIYTRRPSRKTICCFLSLLATVTLVVTIGVYLNNKKDTIDNDVGDNNGVPLSKVDIKAGVSVSVRRYRIIGYSGHELSVSLTDGSTIVHSIDDGDLWDLRVDQFGSSGGDVVTHIPTGQYLSIDLMKNNNLRIGLLTYPSSPRDARNAYQTWIVTPLGNPPHSSSLPHVSLRNMASFKYASENVVNHTVNVDQSLVHTHCEWYLKSIAEVIDDSMINSTEYYITNGQYGLSVNTTRVNNVFSVLGKGDKWTFHYVSGTSGWLDIVHVKTKRMISAEPQHGLWLDVGTDSYTQWIMEVGLHADQISFKNKGRNSYLYFDTSTHTAYTHSLTKTHESSWRLLHVNVSDVIVT